MNLFHIGSGIRDVGIGVWGISRPATCGALRCWLFLNLEKIPRRVGMMHL